MADDIKNTVLIEFKSNFDEYSKQAAESAKAIDQLKAKIKELQKAEGDNSKEIEAAKAQLRAQQAGYRQATKGIDNYSKATKSAEGSQEQATAIAALYNAELAKQSGNLVKDANGNLVLSQAYTQAAAKAKAANDAVNQFNLGAGKGTTNVGLYGESMQGVIDKLTSIPGASGGAVQGIMGMVKASLAFIATPLGAILALIVGAITLVGKAFSKSEGSMNKLKQVTGALSGVFSGLLKALQPVVEFIADTVIKTFEALAWVAEKTMGLISKGLSLLGFDKAAKAVDNFTESIKASTKAGEDLAKMEAELQKSQRNARLIQLEYQKQAEKLRQIRDDESKSINERIQANERLGQVLKEQLNAELQIANLALAIADKRIAMDGESTENLDARAAALTTVADIQERITGQESEQLANLNSLKRDFAAQQKEMLDKQIKAEEDWFKQRQQIDQDFQKAQDAEIKSVQIQSDALLAIRVEATKKERNLREQEKQRLINERMNNAQLEYEIAQLAGQERLDLDRQYLEQQKAQEIAAAEGSQSNIFLINEKYRLLNEKLEMQSIQNKVALASGFMGNLATIFGKNTKVGKLAASAQITIDSIAGGIAAFKSLAGIPIIGPALGAAAATAAGVAGLKAIKDVWRTKSGLPGDSGGGGGSVPIPRFVATRVNDTANTAKANLASSAAPSSIGGGTSSTTINNGISADDVKKIAESVPPQKIIIEEYETKKARSIQIQNNASF